MISVHDRRPLNIILEEFGSTPLDAIEKPHLLAAIKLLMRRVHELEKQSAIDRDVIDMLQRKTGLKG
jgi:hypothetical protein